MTPLNRGAHPVTSPHPSSEGPFVERRNPASRERLLLRLEGEFTEMPGLRLTSAQASRLLALDLAACDRVLHALVDRGVLRLTGTGHYVRRPALR